LIISGQGATTTVYRDMNTAVKLYVNAPPREAENEAERQRFAYDAGLPVPEVYGVRKLDGNQTALDMEYIDGRPLLYPKMDKDERINAVQTMVKLQCMVHKVSAQGQPKQADRLERRIRDTSYLNDAVKNRLLLLLRHFDTDAANLCHGDFHSSNILCDGNKHWIIDWVDATAGNPHADVCRTYLLFMQHAKRIAGIYLRAFYKEANAKPEELLAWLPVVAAGRLNEKVDDKTKVWLLKIAKGENSKH